MLKSKRFILILIQHHEDILGCFNDVLYEVRSAIIPPGYQVLNFSENLHAQNI